MVVERADLVRGFQHAKDQYVPITEEELESLEAEANKSIDVKEFIPLPQSILSISRTPTISASIKAGEALSPLG
jgi:non-homologous end joining protein Ku